MKTRILSISIILLTVILFSAILTGCQPTTAPAAPTTPSAPSTETRTITDMFGRTVTIPAKINMVLGCSPMDTTIVFMIAPDKLGGLTIPFNVNPMAIDKTTGDKPFVNDKYKEIPVVGGWFAMYTTNYETFIAMEPDLIFESQKQFIDERQSKMGSIPVVGIDIWDSTLDDYIPCINFAADVIGAEEQAAKLIDYFEEALSYVDSVTSKLTDSQRIKVYYAEGKDGLSTDPKDSAHTELVDLCKAENVANVVLKPGYGMAEVSIETILAWNPDVIIIGRGTQQSLYELITTDPKWAQVKAVKDKRVYVRPVNPLSWFDGPPCTNQIVGIYWTLKTLYPELTQDLDIKEKVREFYTDFYGYALSEDEINSLLLNPDKQ